MRFISHALTVSREISSEMEFDVAEEQIFNSREFAKTLTPHPPPARSLAFHTSGGVGGRVKGVYLR